MGPPPRGSRGLLTHYHETLVVVTRGRFETGGIDARVRTEAPGSGDGQRSDTGVRAPAAGSVALTDTSGVNNTTGIRG